MNTPNYNIPADQNIPFIFIVEDDHDEQILLKLALDCT
jgi:hypothetical protein